MTCQAILSWTFSGLVGAFLDLAIAYLLLCGSTLAYLASNFLGLFGLSLPCPCNGLFGNPNYNNCLQRQLVDSPSEKISSVQYSVRSKFPFDSIWSEDHSGQLNLNLVNERSHENGQVELDEGEASCSLFSERMSQDVVGRESALRNEVGAECGVINLQAVKEERFDLKGKGLGSQRLRYGLWRRRKCASDSGKFSSVSSDDTLQSDAPAVSRSPASVSKMGNEVIEATLAPDNYEGDGFHHEITEAASHGEEFKCNVQRKLAFDGNEKNAIRVLEQALEEEHAARAALYLELEKERSAAASATDEAMAMILRLQEEKASIEMEARQYQRMIEEKSSYDAEEMNILKEILVRREREKHFLEKEVEGYRQMYFGNEQLDADMHDITVAQGQRESLLYSSEDPVLTLQRIDESVCDMEREQNGNNLSEYEVTSIESQNRTLAFGKELPIPELDEDVDSSKLGDIHRLPSIDKLDPHLLRTNDEINQEIQEKGIVSVDDNPIVKEREVQRPEECSQCEEEQKQSDGTSSCHRLTSKTTGTCKETKIIVPCNDGNKKHRDDSRGSVVDVDLRVHDVHVIDDEINMHNEVNGNKSEQLPINSPLNAAGTCDSPTMVRLEKELYRNRSSSDITNGLPPLGCSRGRSLLSDLRRNSMSAVDYERLKIDNEVGWLRERLRIVQEGREKLGFSVGHREKEKIQLQLLEDIASQLREIRQLTEPGKAVCQTSLPPLCSKLMSKKKRWRSVSFSVHRST